MAIKDWKKISGYTIWERKDGVRIDIDKADITGGWWVIVYDKDTERKLQENIKFKTKSQALGYARQYMRTH